MLLGGCRSRSSPPWSGRVAAAVVTMVAVDLAITLVTVLVIRLATVQAVPVVGPVLHHVESAGYGAYNPRCRGLPARRA